MTKHINKTGLKLTIIFAFILLIEYLFSTLFPGWTFRTGTFVIANKILSYLSFLGLIFFLLFTFKPKSGLTMAVGFVISILFLLLVYFEITAIDTTTEPVDLTTIKTYTDGKKLVVRQYKNAKTNEEIQDTVLVKDVYAFRRIYL